jgi:hypothetical protein
VGDGVSEGLGVSDGTGDGDSVALGVTVGVDVGVGTGVGEGFFAHAGAARNTRATNTPMIAAHLIISFYPPKEEANGRRLIRPKSHEAQPDSLADEALGRGEGRRESPGRKALSAPLPHG